MICGKLLFRVILFLLTFSSKRFSTCRRFIFLGMLIEAVAEYTLYQISSIGMMETLKYRCWLSFSFVSIYVAALIVSCIMSLLCSEESMRTVSPLTMTKMNKVLEELEAKFRAEQEFLRKDRDQVHRERELFQAQLLSLHKHFKENFSQRCDLASRHHADTESGKSRTPMLPMNEGDILIHSPIPSPSLDNGRFTCYPTYHDVSAFYPVDLNEEVGSKRKRHDESPDNKHSNDKKQRQLGDNKNVVSIVQSKP